MRPRDFSEEWRFQIVRTVVFFFFTTIILRLFQIQVLNVSRYRAQAREQQWQSFSIPAKRGSIYTSDGYAIATVRTIYTLYGDASQISKTADIPSILAEYIPDIDKESIEESLLLGKKWFKIADGLNWEQKASLDSLGLKGLYFEESYKRFYPESTMLGHVLGFVGYNDQGEQTGYFGLEQKYDGDLRGQSGWILQEKSAYGNPILWGGVERIESVDGSDLYLTIDRKVQFVVEKDLEIGVKKYGAKGGTVIVLEPSTGAVIAMANYPYFDPASYAEDLNVRNDALAAVYEPGSVVKALTMSAAIDMGKVVPSSSYNDTGPRVFSGYTVDNWDGKHHGNETMVEILQHSNNLGAAWVGMQIGDKALMDYFSRFGFGSKTQIDLEGEESGFLYRKFPMKDIEIANASFGQGISVTPLQLTAAFAAIANKGIYMRPYIVQKIDTKKGVVQIEPHESRKVISPQSADTMVYMLTEAAAGGEAQFFVLKTYNVAGKTGTAQIPVEGGYDPDRTNATFVGFFPSYKNFVMLVKLEEPTFPSGYASETAVPLWMKIAEELANYYGLAPDK